MNPGLVVIAACVTVVFCGAWCGLLFVIPKALTSMYRYRLWQIRDKIMDDLLFERVPRGEAFVAFLERVEGAIRSADYFTPAHCLPGLLLPRDAFRAAEEKRNQAVAQLSENARETYLNYQKEYEAAIRRHVFLGSPSGWALTVAFVLTVPTLFFYFLLTTPHVTPSERVLASRDRVCNRITFTLGRDRCQNGAPLSRFV